MPKVSIVIPAYNHEKYVGEAIQSALDQTYQDFEIIITDDASTDNTAAEIKKIKDPRIKLTCFEKNQGGSVAANNGIQQSNGQYIAILNSDDVFLPDKLEKQVKFLDEHENIGAVFGYAKIIDEDGKDFTDKTHFYYDIFKQPNRTRFEWLNYFFYKWNCLCHPSMLIRKECYGNTGLYDPRYAQLPDFDMWIKLCMKYEIHVMPENLIKFRIRKNEANLSGLRPETKIRGSIEFREILKNYINIQSVDNLNRIFPNTFNGLNENDADLIPFCISTLALETTNKLQFEYQYFALNNFFTLLNNPKLAKKINEKFNFTYQDFIKITGKSDYAANLEKISKEREIYAKTLKINVKDKEEYISSLDKAIGEKDKYLKDLEKSIKEKDEYIADLNKAAKESTKYSKDLEKSVKDKEEYLKDLEKNIKEKDNYILSLKKDLELKEKELNTTTKDLEGRKAYIDDLWKNRLKKRLKIKYYK